MIKIVINSDNIVYLSRSNIKVTPGNISTLDGSVSYNVSAIDLIDGMNKTDVESLTMELERKDTIPTFFVKISRDDINTIEEIKEEELMNLDNKETKTKRTYAETFGFTLSTDENKLKEIVETFVYSTWKDYLLEQSCRTENNIKEGTPCEQAITYFAKELKAMKDIVNDFVNEVKNEL